jgi:hypothetical protein
VDKQAVIDKTEAGLSAIKIMEKFGIAKQIVTINEIKRSSRSLIHIVTKLHPPSLSYSSD